MTELGRSYSPSKLARFFWTTVYIQNSLCIHVSLFVYHMETVKQIFSPSRSSAILMLYFNILFMLLLIVYCVQFTCFIVFLLVVWVWLVFPVLLIVKCNLIFVEWDINRCLLIQYMKRATIFILFFILENNVYFGTLFIIQNCILFI